MRKLTVLEKRLVALSAIGVWIEHRDGHRWIECDANTEFFEGYVSFNHILEKYGVKLNNKIYGGVIEALDVIDSALKLCNSISLREIFDKVIDDGEGNSVFCKSTFASNDRIDIVEKGKGGLY